MSIIDGMDQSFNNRWRVGIMAILVVNEWVDFNSLKKLLEIEDGTLASHLKKLEELNCIQFKKEFVGRKPRTSYRSTPEGKEAFEKHLKALERLINNQTILKL